MILSNPFCESHSDSEESDSEEILNFGYKLSNRVLSPGSEVSLIECASSRCNDIACERQGREQGWESICGYEARAEQRKEKGRRTNSMNSILEGSRKMAAWGLGFVKRGKEDAKERVGEKMKVPMHARGGVGGRFVGGGVVTVLRIIAERIAERMRIELETIAYTLRCV